MPRLFTFLPVLALVLASSDVAAAQDGPVTRYVRGRYDALTAALGRPAGAARDTAVGEIIDDLLDIDAMAQAALGDHWGEMTPAQQTEFVELLRTLIRHQYLGSVGDITDYALEWSPESDVSGGTLVTMSARPRAERRAEPITIAYSMHNIGGTWRAFDITTEGTVSTVTTYRRSFHRIISEHGIDGLLQRMRDRRDRESAD